jgi:hypothetical protein
MQQLHKQEHWQYSATMADVRATTTRRTVDVLYIPAGAAAAAEAAASEQRRKSISV